MGGRWRRAVAVKDRAGGLAAALVATLALGGCHPAKFGEGRNHGDRAVTVTDRLNCPDEQGGMKRTIQAADGKSCTYVGDDGEQATLAYLPLDGKPAATALAPMEASFRSLVPAGAQAAATDIRDTGAAAGGTKASGSASWSADDSDDDDAKADAGDRKRDRVAINLPGVHINADDGGASIHAFGQNITADDKGAVVSGAFNGSRTSIKADDDGAEIRAGFVGKQAVDLTYILASDAAGPGGAHAAAYVARGPVGGPLVVASGTLKDADRHVDKDRFDDLRELVDRNVRRGRP